MNHSADFNDSFERNVSNNYEVFFQAFYESFQAKSPEIKAVFQNTEKSRRHEMLEDSILMLMECSLNHAPSEHICRLAEFHRERGIPEAMYDVWLESLVETLYRLDAEFTAAEEEAWRAVLLPGISYMRQHAY